MECQSTEKLNLISNIMKKNRRKMYFIRIIRHFSEIGIILEGNCKDTLDINR